MNPSVPLLLITWCTVAAILLAPVAATALCVNSAHLRDERSRVIIPVAILGVLGYTAFFAGYYHPLAARLLSWTVLAGSWLIIAAFAVSSTRRPAFRPLAEPLLVVFLFGVFCVSLLYTPVGTENDYNASAVRFIHLLPPDPVLPATLAEQLYAGERASPFVLDWLSSDRPPLQSGLYLLVLPLAHAFSLPIGLAYQCVGTLAQLVWLPAVWLLARSFGRDCLAAFACVLIVATSGFALHHSIFVWPKLLAGGFTLFAALLILDPRPADGRRSAVLAGACAALAWLAHGSAAFALLGLGIAWLLFRAPLRKHLPSLLMAFALLAIPWILYQRFLDPPGNRLLKTHLAGVPDLDPRGTWETLRDAYRSLTWPQWWFARKANFLVTTYGSFREIFDLSAETAKQRRTDEFFYLFRSLGVLGFAAVAWLITRLLPGRLRAPAPPFLLRAFIWSVATFAMWCLLMFVPATTVVHQGAYSLPLVLLTALAVLTLDLPTFARIPILLWHAAYFARTWLAYDHPAPPNPSMILLTGTTLVLLGVTFLHERRQHLSPAQTSASPAQTPSSSAAASRA